MRTGEGKTLTGTLPGRAQRDRRQGRPRRHRQRLPRAPRRRVDVAALRLPRPQRRHPAEPAAATRTSTRPTTPTSRTARTPSSASTTCATTWRADSPAVGRRRSQRDRRHFFAMVDEVDNILIDEARTPLIISGAPEQAAELYVAVRQARAPTMKPGKVPEGMDPRMKKEFVADFDYEFDEKHKTVSITEQRRRQGREVPRDRQPLQRRERPPRQPPAAGAEGRVALQARRRLRRRSTAKSRSSTSSPAASSRAAAGPRACTRRSRPRKACASRRRTRRSPRSPTRTTSASTTSSRA